MIETTDQAFAEAMRAVVAERGEGYVYPREWRMGNMPGADLDSGEARGTCRYAAPDGDGPGCLIGAALHRIGVPLVELMHLDSAAPGAPTAIAQTVTGLSNAVIDAAASAQSHQDRELSWGAALDAFNRERAENEYWEARNS